MEGATIFYAGPTPAAAGRPLGSVGPTTASRMDSPRRALRGPASSPPSARASAAPKS
ncbi:MAG: fumarate hydratase C-terminal domain-containing protein [Adlercreutzia sp.]